MAKARATDITGVMRELAKATAKLEFGAPVAHVYRPLDYAWPLAEQYLERFGEGPKEVLFLGMNPGPFGMGQTGVPFGDVPTVRDFLKLAGKVKPPKDEHPKRPVLGLDCTRVEVSGQRLWGAIAKRHPDPATFFERAFVLNYCPLLFLGERGENVTPDKLKAAERAAVEEICDGALARAIEVLAPRHLVGVGLYAKKRFEIVTGGSRPVASVPHPSPASPAANKGWEGLARSALEEANVRGLL